MEDQTNHLFKSTDDIEPDEKEESLSLRDLPLTTVDHNSSVNHSRRSSSDTFFEFLVNRDVASPQNDVISRGRLLPFNPQPPPPRRSFSLSSATTRAAVFSRSESTRSETQTIRACRSLDGRKIRRNSSLKSESFSRNSSKNNQSNNTDTKSPPPWYWLAFGIPAKIPSEMELKNIRSRICRRSLPPAASSSGERSSSATAWKVLNVLSCKSHASVDDVSKTSPFYNRSLRNVI